MIWFISFGETSVASRISPAQSAGTPSKSFVPPQSGMEVEKGRECTEDFQPLLFPNHFLPYFCIHPALLFCFAACSAWCLALWCLTHPTFLIYCTLSQSLLSTQILAPVSQDEVLVKRLNLLLFCLITYTNEFHLNPTTLEDQVQYLLTTIILYASKKNSTKQKKSIKIKKQSLNSTFYQLEA